MSVYHMFDVIVSDITQMTPRVKCITLQKADGSLLPEFTGGSHIIVQISDGDQCYSNAYSLINDPADRSCYQIAVQLAENSRGGSAWLHHKLKQQDTLTISTPNNQFCLAEAQDHLLIAGGIGITPFISQLYELHRQKKNYSLHYCLHTSENNLLQQNKPLFDFIPQVDYHISTAQCRLDILTVLQQVKPATHIYVCGPHRLTEAVITAAKKCGIADEYVHFEQFSLEETPGNAFTVVLSRSGKELEVPENMTILQVIENNKAADVECLCREGICGTCETTILEGEAEHRDHYFSEEERAAQKTMLICCSRSKSKRLVLDL